MKLGWLEDLVALVESKTLSEAASRRHLTQSAFTRRIQGIEQWLGVPVVKSGRRPTQLTQAVLAHQTEIRSLIGEFYRLRAEIQASENESGRVLIASTHSITTTHMPAIVSLLRRQLVGLSIRIRSANQDECATFVMTREVSAFIGYETKRFPIVDKEGVLERVMLDEDKLIPCISSSHPSIVGGGNGVTGPLDIVAYPSDVFLGKVLHNQILPELSEQFEYTISCETALTQGVLEFTTAGMGIGWLPRSIARAGIENGSVLNLGMELGEVSLFMVACRLKGLQSQLSASFWRALEDYARTNRKPG